MENQGTVVSEFGRIKFNQTPSWKCSTKFSQPPTELKQNTLISQMVLSIQLPFTVFLQVGLTSSRKVMGQYVNSKWSSFVLYAIAGIVTVLNIMLLISELS